MFRFNISYLKLSVWAQWQKEAILQSDANQTHNQIYVGLLQLQQQQVQQIIKEINFEKQNFKHKVVLQFATHNCQQLQQVATTILQKCTPDYVEVNMGCSQDIAKKGQYGSYLTTDLQLCLDLIGVLDSVCKKLNKTTQISLKTRLFDNLVKLLYQAITKYNVTLITVRGILTFKTVGAVNSINDNLKVIEAYKQLKLQLSQNEIQYQNIKFIVNGGLSGIQMHKKLCQYVDGTMSATGLFQNYFIYNEQKPIKDHQKLIDYITNEQFKTAQYFSIDNIYKLIDEDIKYPIIYEQITKEEFYNQLTKIQNEMKKEFHNREYKQVQWVDFNDIQVGISLSHQHQVLREFKGDYNPIFFTKEVVVNNLLQAIVFTQNYIHLKDTIQLLDHCLQAHVCRLIHSCLMNINVDIRKILTTFVYTNVDKQYAERARAQSIIYICLELIKRIRDNACYY